MAEVLVDFDVVLRGRDNMRYGAQACGRARPDDLWEGWIEFPSLDGGATLRSGRETTQPNRDDLLYWATGLTDPYLDGALLRTQGPAPPALARSGTSSLPAYDRPADLRGFASAAATAAPRAVLDPFAVYADGDHVLRGQLGALSAGHLRTIVRAYGMTGAEPHDLERVSKPDLVTMIMQAVERPR